MPRKAKRAQRKRAYRRRGKRGSKTTLMNNSIQPIASRYFCKMKYADTFQLSTGGGGLYRFNLNSTFDPNRSGIGHQLYGRDQLAILYNRYRVWRVSYALSFYNSSTSCKVAVVPSNIEMGASTTSEFMENPQSKWAIQLPGGSQKVIKGTVDLARLTGRTKTQYMADDRYQAEAGSSPAELLILNILGGTILDAGTTIDCSINLTYHVEWFDRASLAQS